jgi:hypothetical protein
MPVKWALLARTVRAEIEDRAADRLTPESSCGLMRGRTTETAALPYQENKHLDAVAIRPRRTVPPWRPFLVREIMNLLAQSLLQTDGCIIAADAEHVVFAIRIPRKTIRDNHHLLLAASEACVDQRVEPTAPKP